MWFLVITLALLVVIIMLDGKLGWHMTEVPEGSMKFVVAGGDYIRTILNSKDLRMKPDKETIEVGSSFKFPSLIRLLGFHWVSWIWPAQKVYWFELKTGALVPVEERKDKSIDKWVTTHTHPTDRLDVKIRCYFLLRDVEMKDRFTVNIVVYALLTIVNPRKAVFLYKADFVSVLSSAILSGYADNSKEKSYAEFVELKKGRGSKFADKVFKYINKGGGPKDTRSLEDQYGVCLEETFIEEIQLSEESQAVIDATKAEEVAKLQAAALVAEAQGDADARNIKAGAKASEMGVAIQELVKHGVNADVAANAYATIRSTENLPALAVWGGNATAMIPVGNQNTTPAKNNPPTKSNP